MPLLYAEVILPLPMEAKFTYAIPENCRSRINVGMRVVVPFGTRKFYTGIVDSFTHRTPEGFQVKEIVALLDDKPIIRHPQLKLWNWVADYYMCGIGDVYKAAVPSGLKIESETFVEINPDYESDGEDATLDERRAMILQSLDHEGALPVAQLEKATGQKGITRLVSSMIEDGLLIISEKVVERYKPLIEHRVALLVDDHNRAEAFQSVKGAQKQERLLLALMELCRHSDATTPQGEKHVEKKALLERAGVTAPILQAIVKKGLARIFKSEINRFKYSGGETADIPLLSVNQDATLQEIIDNWQVTPTVLLHGVTSSGKTEIYAHLAEKFLARGEQVLYLVPEIALTTQLTERLQRIFGNRVVVYHSKFTDNERVDIWKRMLESSEPWIILGARSSLFLPFAKLGLVIVDEEHESSYKQSEPAPRYNARDVAIVLASMHGAKTLLGSATPSVETYFKATTGKFGLVSLMQRWGDRPLPPVRISDLTTAKKKRATVGPFTLDTVKEINSALDSDHQVILFRNRRGFAPLARCRQCAWIPKCNNCDVTLTYHQHQNRLVCHYCGATYPLPDLCPQCGQPTVDVVGYGTERVEEEIEQVFPSRSILRMDLDTTRNKDRYETIIRKFSEHKADILVGTQMVTKGLDFRNVSTVVVVNADELINTPDFKANERAFNMLEQVAGRAGRHGEGESSVIVQTWQPSHPIFPKIIKHDYAAFYNAEIKDRENFLYPPFTRIIYIYLKHHDRQTLQTFSNKYAARLKQLLGNRVQGPDQPKIARIKSLYIQKIMIKIEANGSMAALRDVLRGTYKEMAADKTMRTTTVYYDVDP